ncbi:MAG: flagellar brake protein [Clostridiales bacterium]|jgi:c-di-GMP-binding flagellar brake protein YcgR|nr:flagellar brake protein [Clostridiales bacterium]
MLYNFIGIGDRIEITDPGDPSGKIYISQVEDTPDDGELLVHAPISYGQYVRLNLTEKYSLLIFTDHGMVRFDSEIISYAKENAFLFMRARLLSGGERVQRREFFRYPCLLPIKFARLPEGGSPKAVSEGIIKDLGGGGIRFVSNEAVDEDVRIKCIMMLGDDCLAVVGTVLGKQFFPKSSYKYQYRIQFTGINKLDQEKVVQYIFNEQRKKAVGLAVR